MSEPRIRDADPARDGAACAAIYAPHVEGSAVSFEERAPDAAEMAARIERYGASHAWLVAERGGRVVGYAYATAFNERPGYRWSAGVSVYVAAEARGIGVGRALYEALFARLRERGFRMACAGITLPNEASAACTRASASSRSASTARSAGRRAPGATSAGTSWSCATGAKGRRRSRVSPPGYHWACP